MFVYRDTLKNFNQQVDNGVIARIVAEKIKSKHIGIGPSEINAYDKSLEHVSRILSPLYFDQDLECAIEYRINSCGGSRIDFMLSGYDDNNNKNIVLFELKQWSYENINLIDQSENIEALVSRGHIEEKPHPSSQALGYANMFKLYYEVVTSNKCHIYPCSYMHEYIEKDPHKMTDERYSSLLNESPAFFKEDNEKLRSFIKRYLKKSDKGVIFEELENSEIVPSKNLKENIDSLILNNSKIQLIDEQQVAFNAIYCAVKKAIVSNKKNTFIIKGGPGTGKSIIALKLVGKVTKELNARAFYTTYNSAPRHSFIDTLKKSSDGDASKKATTALIRWSGSWVREESFDDELTLVVADEAHRLQTSCQGAREKGLTMIGEIIRSSKVSVFFLDEKQFVHCQDKGTRDNIKKEAEKFGSQLIEKEEYNLKTQFRCGGSDGYISFLRKLIYNEDISNPVWLKDFQFRVFDNETPKEMMDELRTLNNNGAKSRVVAGYCYEWNHKTDVAIKDFTRLWNKDTQTWGFREDSFEEIGCAFSSQGIEFDYVGVIIGNDMKFENGKVTFHPENHARTDTSSKIYFKKDSDLSGAIQLIKNHYFVLLTRGVKGCFVYCQDRELAKHIKQEFENTQNLLLD